MKFYKICKAGFNGVEFEDYFFKKEDAIIGAQELLDESMKDNDEQYKHELEFGFPKNPKRQIFHCTGNMIWADDFSTIKITEELLK